MKEEQIKLPAFVPDPEHRTLDLRYKKDYKIPVNYGHGLKWTAADGHKFRSILRPSGFKDGKRVVRLVESNLLFSMGASHYYARFETSGIDCYDLTEDKIYSLAGYGPERESIDPYLSRISFEVERRLTKLEKDIYGERIGKKGDWTYRFNSESEARDQGIVMFKLRFAPGWVLVSDDDGEKILAET